MAKRKAPDVLGDRPGLLASLDLSSSKTTTKVVAAALLSLLPNGATGQDASAKKLVQAFPLFMAELDARTSAMARKSESDGTRLPIAFRFPSGTAAGGNDEVDDDEGGMDVIHIPEECFVKTMTFLNGREKVIASTVCKVWLSISRMPESWERLNHLDGLSNKSKRLNMTSLLALLNRPQFTNLKFLMLPNKCKLGKNSAQKIARACPYLETWDIGYSGWGGRGKDCDLVDATEHFANLTSIHTSTYDVTNCGITSVAKAMGSQLLDLRIKKCSMLSHSLSDSTLGVISERCPNLKYFAYNVVGGNSDVALRYSDVALRKMLSVVGITRLIKGCRRLEVLELVCVRRLSREDFVAILSMLEHDDVAAVDGNSMHALRKIDLCFFPFVIGDKPFSVVDKPEEQRTQPFVGWS